jgi:UDP-N-acetylglucosamine--N-acetylmuramyl-(pentapeptide) pyrophosphoryl-undecaprenol N-acetylglucosamine transferase
MNGPGAAEAPRGARVVLAGGGTAGHVEPALALGEALLRRDPTVEVAFLGTARGLEARLVPARGQILELISAVPIPRRPGGDLVAAPARVRKAVAETAAVLDRRRAEVVVGFGGYVAGPAYLAARRRKIPVVVHEANARPGLANRLGARFAAAVVTAGPEVPLPGAAPLGIPLRTAITRLDRVASRPEALAHFGLEPGWPTLLVFGGSQGARRLNEAALGAASALASSGVQVLHATGRGHAIERPTRVAGEAPYVVVEYIERMELAYAAADLALCRAGALTVAELTAVGLPAAYAPLPIGNGEQRLNAEPVVRAGGGLLVADEDCTSEWIAATLAPLAADASRLRAMSEAAARGGQRDADERLADLVLALVARCRQPAGGPL